MTTSATQQYHFSQEQRTQLGQVYKLILSWRQERLAARALVDELANRGLLP